MSDASSVAKSLRERLSGTTEERLGRALSDLLENPMLTAAIGRAFDAREKASQAQEVAMGALNIPSAGDIERLTRRLRSVSHRLEGIEDGVDQLNRALSPTGVEARLSAIEEQLQALSARLHSTGPPPGAAGAGSGAASTPVRAEGAKADAGAKAAHAAKPPRASKRGAAAKRPAPKRSA